METPDNRQQLKAGNLKVTPQRLAILTLLGKINAHPDADELYFELRKTEDNVSRATVYRVLDALVENSIVRKLEFGDGRARYEMRTSASHHDHLICIDCGKVEEFFNEEIESLQVSIAKKFDFKLERHVHQLFGICQDCLNK
jgi:Fur family transcriptional regulator, ferric uptake regulator